MTLDVGRLIRSLVVAATACTVAAVSAQADETSVGNGGALFCEQPDHLQDAFNAMKAGDELATYHCASLPEGTRVAIMQEVFKSGPGAVQIRAFIGGGSLVGFSIKSGFVTRLTTPVAPRPPAAQGPNPAAADSMTKAPAPAPITEAAPLPAAPPPPVAATPTPAAAPPEPKRGASTPPASGPSAPDATSAAVPSVPTKPPDTTPGTVFRDCADCPEMIVLAPGTFSMGSGTTPYDRPVHRVSIARRFAIGRSAVTFADWQHCVDAGGCTFKPDSHGFGEGDHPVINISWSDAKAFVAWLSAKTGKTYRLPSEAEWEYAAHGGTTTAFSWGPAVGSGMANCEGCGGDANPPRTTPVRSFPPNGFGLYDMAGNAAEWVEDCWNGSYRGAPHDGSAWLTGHCEQRVLRGGSFDGGPAYIKPSARFRYDADVRYWANSFRVVREMP